VKYTTKQVGVGQYKNRNMDNSKKNELGNNIHNQIIGWTENCDTKASIMIAFLGIFVSIFFTSDYILKSIQSIVTPILTYWKTGSGSFDFFTCVIFILLGVTIFFISRSVLSLFNVLAGKIKCDEDSIMFFYKIQDQSFNDFLKKIDVADDESIINDRYTQIYNCSKRCAEKFDKYNKAVAEIKWGLLFLCLFVICIIFYNSL
jgi:hypothetical protein